MLMTLQRQRKTSDGILGILSLPNFTCFTIENLLKEIPAGLYTVAIDKSPRLQQLTPHLRVPARDKAAGGDAGIRIHSANWPWQLEGCIAVGDRQEEDAVDDSKETFIALMKILNGKQDLQIQVNDIVPINTL